MLRQGLLSDDEVDLEMQPVNRPARLCTYRSDSINPQTSHHQLAVRISLATLEQLAPVITEKITSYLDVQSKHNLSLTSHSFHSLTSICDTLIHECKGLIEAQFTKKSRLYKKKTQPKLLVLVNLLLLIIGSIMISRAVDNDKDAYKSMQTVNLNTNLNTTSTCSSAVISTSNYFDGLTEGITGFRCNLSIPIDSIRCQDLCTTLENNFATIGSIGAITPICFIILIVASAVVLNGYQKFYHAEKNNWAHYQNDKLTDFKSDELIVNIQRLMKTFKILQPAVLLPVSDLQDRTIGSMRVRQLVPLLKGSRFLYFNEYVNYNREKLLEIHGPLLRHR